MSSDYGKLENELQLLIYNDNELKLLNFWVTFNSDI